MKDGFVQPEEARNEEQRQLMERIVTDGVCPFCLSHLEKYHQRPILWQNPHWIVTENSSPYDGAQWHFLLIAVRHCENFTELKEKEIVSFFDTMNQIVKRYRLAGGTILLRFGDMAFNGSSVKHLHAHLIVGIKKGADTEPIRVKVGHKKTG
ncbi:MAG: HIT domain-containing protein [Candidatus Paceibacterota bacterium]